MKKLEVPLTEEEGEELLQLKQQVLSGNKHTIRVLRRQIRRTLFRTRQKAMEPGAISKLIESQLEGNNTLDDFTFAWDLSPLDPLQVVYVHDWSAVGGKFETIMEPGADGIPRPKRICFPTAFTNQE